MKIDEFYCLNLVETRNRYQHCIEQFKKVNIDVKFWFTTRRPIMQKFGEQFDGFKTDAYVKCQQNNPFTFGAIFSCLFEHYSIIKQAYERGLNNIVIFEDDIKFLIGAEDFHYCLDNIPNGYSTCKFYHSYEECKTFDRSNLFMKDTKYYSCSTLSYAMSRSGMQQFIFAVENKKLLPADLMFCYINNRYINYTKICEPAGFISSINRKIS